MRYLCLFFISFIFLIITFIAILNGNYNRLDFEFRLLGLLKVKIKVEERIENEKNEATSNSSI